jgi:hypothetical protein
MIRQATGFLVVGAVAALLCSCAPAPGPRSVDNPDPLIKIPAIKAAVKDHNTSAEGQMIADLQSDDPAVRFYAIEGLKRLNGGENLGYDFYREPDDPRLQEAVKRWQEWLAARRANEG